MNCKKCGVLGSLVIRKEHIYCVDCFMLNINHKFRACIGKNKILSANEKVLICLTGGKSSTVLLDLIFNGLSQDSHKKLRIVPCFLHITGIHGNENDLKTAELIIKQCKYYKFNVYVVNLSKYYFKKNDTLPELNTTTEVKICFEGDNNYNIKHVMEKMNPTLGNDIEKTIKQSIFLRVASELKCKYIFTAETTTTLAINLLSNLAIGRGSQVENDVGFSDNRDEHIKILRPMKDITEEELHHYIKLKQLDHVSDDHIRKNSLQSVIKTFVSDLQENFPATISTVCKTADKIKSVKKNTLKCVFCKSSLGPNNNRMTALQATVISRTVSNHQPNAHSYVNDGTPDTRSEHYKYTQSMFPHIDEYLCYSCSKNYLESGLQHLIEIKTNP